MLESHPKSPLTRLLFFLVLTVYLCFPNPLSAKNTHEGILGQSLTSGTIVKVPPKKEETQQDKKKPSRSLNKYSQQKGSSGATSVQANRLKIDSRNTITGAIDSKHGANIVIGGTDISNVQLDSAVLDTENTVYGRVKAQGDEARYRMGTVDIEGIRGGSLGISTENTVMGDVSVKNGQDVAIGVVEIGKPKKAQKEASKKDASRNMPGNNTAGFISKGDYGQIVDMPLQEILTENEGSSIGTCEKEPVCFDSNNVTGCYDINGCSAVANTLGAAKFGEDGGNIFEDNRYIACNSHDQCYQTCDTDKRACDIQFYYDLIDECRRTGADTNNEKILSIRELEERGAAAKRGLEEITNDAKKAAIKTVVITAVGTVGSGSTGFVPAAIVGLEEGAKGFAIDFATGMLLNPDYRYAGKQGIISIPHLVEGYAESKATSIRKYKEEKDNWINEWEKKWDASAKNLKTAIDKSSDKIKASIYDVASATESLGFGFNSLLDETAQNLAPKESFINSLPKNSGETCDVNKGFWGFVQAMGCEMVSIPSNIYAGAEMVTSAASWGSKKAGSYILESTAQVADYAGSILAEDIRLWGEQGVNSMQYIGHKSIDLSNSSGKFTRNAINDFDNLFVNATIFVSETTAKEMQGVRSLLYDCLSTAEDYYIGVYAKGEDHFRGKDRETCEENKKIGEKCCVKNSSYNYHNSGQGPNQLTNYLDSINVQSPFEKCLTEKRNITSW